MKKILFVVKGYYPDISASGNLLKPLVDEMAKHNFIFVLSCSSKQDEGEYTKNLMYKKIEVEKNSTNFLSKAIRFIKNNLVISNFSIELVNKIKREIESLDEKYNFDSVIAVTYDEILALMNSSINPEKKMVFILEKLPVSSTMKIPLIYKYKIKYRKKIEEKIIQNTSKIFALPIMHRYFSLIVNEENKEKLIQLEHPMITNRISRTKKDGSNINLIYAGGLDRKQRNPMVILDFFKKVKNQLNINISFYSYGNMQRRLSQFSKKNSFLKLNETINSEILNEKMIETDFIITIGNKDSELVPSKIFDCISTGKPIIHFSQLDQDPYTSYLSKYENSIVIKYTSLSLEETLKNVCVFLENTKGNLVDFNKIRENFKECTPEYVEMQILNNI